MAERTHVRSFVEWACGHAYRLFLIALPRPERERFGEAMSADLEGALRDGDSTLAVLGCALRECGNVWWIGITTRGRGITMGWTIDLKGAVRSLLRRRVFSLASVATLAVAIGATTAMFSFLDGVVLRALPYDESDRLVRLITTYEGSPDPQPTVSAPDAFDVRRTVGSLESVAIYRQWGPTLTGMGPAEQISGLMFSDGFLDALGIGPEEGRGFVPDEDIDGQDQVLILSHAFWTSRFGADADAIGRTITLNGVPHVIVGIAPERFGRTLPGFPAADVWRPLGFGGIPTEDLPSRGNESFHAIARLAPGATIEVARSELAVLMLGIEAEYPGTNVGQSMTVTPIHEHVVAEVRRVLFIFAAAVALLLVAGLSNVVGLFFGQAVDRGREIALRAALGASRHRVYRLLLIEGSIIAGAGALFGLGVAFLALPALVSLSSGAVPLTTEVSIDPRAIVAAAFCGLVAALTAGLVPAVWGTRSALGDALRGGSARSTTDGGRNIRLRRAVVTVQVAVSVLLLVGSGLLARSLARLTTVDPGVETNLLTFRINPPAATYPTDESIAELYRRVRDRVSEVDGVEAVAFTTGLPMTERQACGSLFATDDPSRFDGEDLCAEVRAVSSDYFELVGLPVVRGRGFGPEDEASSPDVVIVNERTAALLWPGQDPLGREIETGLLGRTHRVVGVVPDVKQFRLSEPAPPQTYLPITQWPRVGRNVVVRAGMMPADRFPALRQAMMGIDPDIPLTEVGTIGDFVRETLVTPRMRTALLSVLAAIALMMSVAGVYGLVSYSVSRRRKEIAIRMSLGATRPTLLRVVVTSGLVDSVLGAGIGVCVAWTLSGFLESILFSVTTRDPITFLAAPAIVVLVALLASAVPALRATSLHPATVLRSE